MDWVSFLESNRIPFDTRGKNVSGNHIVIACPWCGGDDPSRHLVVNLSGQGWHCWRNRQHRGKSAVKLICALIRCTVDQARAIAGEHHPVIPESLTDMVASVLQPTTSEPQPLALPAEFKSFRGQYSSQRFVQYLRGRHFPAPLEELTKQYDMFYASTGPFFGRVLFMIRSAKGELMAWSGRSIYPNEKLRYKTEGPAGEYLLWLDKMFHSPSHTLVLCEGPMDALKVSAFGKEIGVDATCCFTSTPTKRQIDYLYWARPLYKHMAVMLDQGEVANMLWTTDALSALRIRPIWLTGRKDPGEIRSPGELRELLGLALV